LRASCSSSSSPDGTVKILVEGAQRAKVVKYTDCSKYYEAEAIALGDTMGERVEATALARTVRGEHISSAVPQ
jgi:ATP-dependent Lon protease